MTTSSRVRGNVNPLLTFKIGTGTATSYSDDVKKVALKSEDKDAKDLTFFEASQGVGLDYTLTLTAIVSFDAGSLWSYLWTSAGQTALVTYGPKGNATASPTSPQFQFSVTLRRGDIEVEADGSGKSGAEFEVELTCVSDVTRLIA